MLTAMSSTSHGRDRILAPLAAAAALALLVPVFHVKLGSIFLLAAGWAGVMRWLDRKRGGGPAADPGREFLVSLRSGLLISVLVFGGLSAANILARTINPGWRWFQLP
jgi:hypothetical protein